MALPRTEKNLFLHILHAQLQTVLAKSADQQAPPELDITKYGWDIRDGIPVPAILLLPLLLMGVIWCGCKVDGKACSCHHAKNSCMLYYTCGCSGKCSNPHKTVEDSEGGVD